MITKQKQLELREGFYPSFAKSMKDTNYDFTPEQYRQLGQDFQEICKCCEPLKIYYKLQDLKFCLAYPKLRAFLVYNFLLQEDCFLPFLNPDFCFEDIMNVSKTRDIHKLFFNFVDNYLSNNGRSSVDLHIAYCESILDIQNELKKIETFHESEIFFNDPEIDEEEDQVARKLKEIEKNGFRCIWGGCYYKNEEGFKYVYQKSKHKLFLLEYLPSEIIPDWKEVFATEMFSGKNPVNIGSINENYNFEVSVDGRLNQVGGFVLKGLKTSYEKIGLLTEQEVNQELKEQNQAFECGIFD